MKIQLALMALLLLGACKEKGRSTSVRAQVEAEKGAPRLPVKGVRRLSGDVQELRAAPDGRAVTVLLNGRKPAVEGVHPSMRLGELWALSTARGEPVRIGTDVSNLPGGWLFSPDSRWILASADWDVRHQRGSLQVADTNDLSAAPTLVSTKVSYAVASDDGASLAWIEDGALSVGPLPRGPWRQVAGEVSTAEFSPDGRYVYFRRRHAAAGGLYQVDLADPEPKRLLDHVAEFAALRSGKLVVASARATPTDRQFQLHVLDVATRAGRKLADDAIVFRTSKDDRYVAWKTSSIKGDQAEVGDLWVAELPRGTPRKVGSMVKDFEFSPEGTRLLFRENYVELPLGGREAKVGETKLEKVGDLSLVELPLGKPRLLQRLCPNYLFAPDGSALAYTARIEHPEITRRLFLLRGSAEPLALKDWLYEYQFLPTSPRLYFRADCTREGRSCDLLSVGPEDSKPKRESGGVYGMRFSSDGSRAILGSAHLTDETYDLTAKELSSGKETSIDQYVEWPALILGPHGEQVAYLVHEKSRPGLYLASTADK